MFPKLNLESCEKLSGKHCDNERVLYSYIKGIQGLHVFIKSFYIESQSDISIPTPLLQKCCKPDSPIVLSVQALSWTAPHLVTSAQKNTQSNKYK